MTASIDQLKEDFEIYGIQLEEHDVINKCLELCEQHDLTGEQIAVCWLGYGTKAGFSDLSVEGLECLERKEFNKKNKKLKRKVNEDYSSPYKQLPTSHIISGGDEDILAAYGASPATPKNKVTNDFKTPVRSNAKRGLPITNAILSSPIAPSLSNTPGTPSEKYSGRTNQGVVVSAFGTPTTQRMWEADVSFEPEVTELPCGGDNPLVSSYRYMFEKLRECGELLDDEILYLGDQIMDTLEITEQSHVREASNLSQWFVGRICCDSVGRLNAASVLLEGGRATSRGEVVQVDLSEMGSYSLFPGQIVAIKGVNATGSKIMAKEIMTGKVISQPKTNLSIGNEGLQIMVACGPFTTSENLLYEPLDDLLKKVKAEPPNILILLGPILDSNHPSLSDIMLADSFDDIVQRCLDRISASLEGCGIKVLVVSSNKDASCPLVYPTPPMKHSPSDMMKMLSDPCLININGVTIGLTSTDAVMQISKEEISFPPHSGDRIGRLCEHILLQQSFCPLYPPPDSFCLSLEQAELHCSLPFTPHVMVLPSDLRGFAKVVKGCCMVNPERLSKGKGGGCYARIRVTSSAGAPKIEAQVLKI